MKKIQHLCMLTLILLCSFIFNITAHAEDVTGQCGDNLTYTIKYNSNTYNNDLIISGNGDMYNYETPQDAPWYDRRYSINAIYLDDNLTSIGDNTFCNFTDLNIIAIPQKCNKISDTAFTNTNAEIKKLGKVYKEGASSPSIVIGTCGSYSTHEKNVIYELNIETETLTLYGQGEGLMQDYSYTGTQYIPWYYDSNYIKKVIVKNGVKSIGEYIFYRHSSIETVIIEKGTLKNIGTGAFSNCNNLKSVSIEPNGDTCNINELVFENCTSLSEIILPDNIRSIANSAFNGATNVTIKCNADSESYKFAKNNNIKVDTSTCIHNKSYGNKTIDDYIIDAYICTHCNKICGDTVSIKKYIGSDTTVIVPSEIEGLPVTSINGSNKYTGDSGAFSGCENIVKLVLPDTIKVIGSSAFADCTNLESINLPENVSISSPFGGGIFYNNPKLKNLVIPDSVYVTEALLTGQRSDFHLNHVTADPSREGYPWGALQNHVYEDEFTLDQEAGCIDGKKSKHCIYDGCTATTEEIVIPATGKHKSVADEDCTYLYDTNKVKNGKRTYVCPLCKDTITQYLVHIIYDEGFATKEQDVYYCADEEVTLSTDTKDGYQFNNWSGFTTSQDKTISFKMPKEAINLTVTSNKVTTSNNDPNTTTEDNKSVVELKVGDTFEVNKLKYKLIKENEVSLIGSTNKTVKSLNVLASVSYNNKTYNVVQIANKAFNKYSKLEKVTIGNNITEIGSESFSNCKKLKSATLGKNVSKIKTKAFYNCKNLKTIKINSSKLKSIGKKSITNINKKATIKVPKKKLKSYKKLFTSKTGYKKSMKIKK